MSDSVRSFYEKYPFPPAGRSANNTLCELIVSQVRSAYGREYAESVLDLGCGTGIKLEMLISLLNPDYVVGVDASVPALRVARRRLSASAHFVAADIAHFHLNKRFELILCIGVLHHLKEAEKVLRICREHLMDNGLLVIWVYSDRGCCNYQADLEAINLLAPEPFNPERRLDIALALMQAELLHSGPAEYYLQHYSIESLMDTFAHPRVRFYKADELIEMVEANGYTTVHVVSPSPSVLDEIASVHQEADLRITTMPLAQRIRLAELLSPSNRSLCMAFRLAK